MKIPGFVLLITIFCCCSFTASLIGQPYDLLIKGGHLYDVKNGLDGMYDLAIKSDTIAKVDEDISPKLAHKVINATGLWVVPGLIDLHTHVFVGSNIGTFANGINSLFPDYFTFRAGISTVVDAGTAGWENFEIFKSQVIDQSATRILSFINIAGKGMQGKPAEESIASMQPSEIQRLKLEYPDIIVGVKIGHYTQTSWQPFDLAIQACEQSNLPLFVECHLPHYSLEDQLNKMRPGDIISHAFEDISERAPVVGDDGNVRVDVLEAQQRGVLFDVGHGGAGFWFSQAIPAFEQGLWPNTFGTDLHRFSVNKGMKNMLNVMSKFMTIGMPLNDVLDRATWHAAQSIQRPDLGHLGVGAEADVTILRVRNGEFGYVDAAGFRIPGKQKLEAELTIRAGKIVWDLNGISATPYQSQKNKR